MTEKTHANKTTKMSIILTISLCMSIFLEMIQHFVPGRYPGLVDMLLNFIGAVLGLLIIKIYDHFNKLKEITT